MKSIRINNSIPVVYCFALPKCACGAGHAVADGATRAGEIADGFAQALEVKRAGIHHHRRSVINLIATCTPQLGNAAGHGKGAADRMDINVAGFPKHQGASVYG